MVFWLYCVAGMIAVVWRIPNVDTAVQLAWLPLEAFLAIGICKIVYVLPTPQTGDLEVRIVE